MKLAKLHGLLADETRLRILNLLIQGPLCVCHFQDVLGEPQVKISKHLSALRTNGLVTNRRHKNWVIYELVEKPGKTIRSQLDALAENAKSEPVFQRDLKRLNKVSNKADEIVSACCS
ncbi:MAG TPA: metalloregulator ArsR/SmtB family transcription factor [Verrucomicrobiae bacterium]